MKKIFITIWVGLLLAGCTEKGPLINFTNVIVADTTYSVSPVPAPDPHNVLAEDFTGQSCPNCVPAHAILDGIATAGRMNILAYYIIGPPQAVPPTGAAYDFRTNIGTDIGTTIYGGTPGGGIPIGGIDRTTVGGVLALYYSQWTSAYNARLGITDSVNLSVVSTYNATDTTATIVATTTYLQQMSTSQNVTIAIVEDSITDFQETPSGIDSTYLFNDVFRDIVTAENGDPIASLLAVKTPGTTNVRTYTYKVNAAWKVKHCKVVAFVNYGGALKGVLQSENAPLAP